MKKTRENYFWLWILVGLAALSFRLLLIYYSYWHHHYLVPPGNDVVNHWWKIQSILQHGWAGLSGYPPGFHLLVIGISRLFHQPIWTILTSWTPFLLILPAFSIFFLLKQVFSLRISVLASAILLITSFYPVLAFTDGNYPDILAYGVFGVLLFAFLIRYFKTNHYINLILAGVFLVLIAFTHHLTFFGILGVLVIFGLWQFFKRLARSQRSVTTKILMGTGILLLLTALFFILANILYGGVAMQFIRGISQITGSAYLKITPDYGNYPEMSGGLLWFFGLAGLLYILVTTFSQREKAKTKELVIIWILLFFALSRMNSSGIPSRFAREVALPLTIAIAFLLEYLIELNPWRTRFGQILAYALIGYLLITNSALYAGLGRIPDGFADQIWYLPIDQQKIDYLAESCPGGTLLYNPSADPFFTIKARNTLIPLDLSSSEKSVVKVYLNSPDRESSQADFKALIRDLKVKYQSADCLFDDVKPPGNTSPVYPIFSDFEVNKAVLDNLATYGRETKVFEDTAKVYQMK